MWSPLVRDKSSEDYTDLNISPAAQVVEDVTFGDGFFDKTTEKRCLLSIPNDKEADAKDTDTDDDGYSYVSVQDALDDESTLDDTEDEQECMSVFFILPGRVQKYDRPYGKVTWVGEQSRWPQFETDSNINAGYRIIELQASPFVDPCVWSLALNTGWLQDGCLGDFHKSGIKVDNKNCLEVKFKSDAIPDPSYNYIIHNKKFVCEKIEMEVMRFLLMAELMKTVWLAIDTSLIFICVSSFGLIKV